MRIVHVLCYFDLIYIIDHQKIRSIHYTLYPNV